MLLISSEKISSGNISAISFGKESNTSSYSSGISDSSWANTGIGEIKKQSKIQDNVSYDDESRVIVPISVENDDGFLSPYSIKGEEIISQDVADFLEDNIAGSPIKNGLHLQIQGKTIDKV